MRILLVDDHAIVREGLALLLRDLIPVEYIVHASDGRVAIQKAMQYPIDLIILDLSLPDGLSGFETLEELRKIHKEAKIVIFSMHEEIEYQKMAFEKGADGYLIKKAKSEELMQHLLEILNEKKIFGSKEMNDEVNQENKLWDLPITAREKEVFILTVLGHTQKEISEKLSISVKTVENHRRNISRKLKVKKRSEWVEIAKEYNFLH